MSSKISATQFATKTGCFSIEWIHCRTVVLSVHMKTLSIFMVSARWTSFLSLDTSIEAWSSSFAIVKAFIGATLGFPKTKVNSVVDPLSSTVTFARRNATALNTSCEPNKCNSSPSISPTKYARGIVMSLRVGSSLLLSRNFVTRSRGSSSSHCWPFNRQMSLSSSRAFTV